MRYVSRNKVVIGEHVADQTWQSEHKALHFCCGEMCPCDVRPSYVLADFTPVNQLLGAEKNLAAVAQDPQRYPVAQVRQQQDHASQQTLIATPTTWFAQRRPCESHNHACLDLTVQAFRGATQFKKAFYVSRLQCLSVCGKGWCVSSCT